MKKRYSYRDEIAGKRILVPYSNYSEYTSLVRYFVAHGFIFDSLTTSDKDVCFIIPER